MRSSKLVQRSPALALLIGAMAPRGEVGGDADFGSEFGDDDWGFDEDDVGADFGDDWGAEAGASPKPTPTAVAKVWKKHASMASNSKRRNMLLEPNKGSAVKVERYSFNLEQEIAFGTAEDLVMTEQPDVTIRPQTLTMNAPTPMFATVSEIKVANVSVTVSSRSEDAYNYNANGWGRSLDCPTLSPANRATIRGRYTGYTPPGFVAASTVLFTASFKGPASIVA
jgi:hypothetical protein